MPELKNLNYKSKSLKSFLAGYFIRSICSDVATLGVLLLLIALIIYKLDLPVSVGEKSVYFIIPVTAFVSSLISVIGFKNNVLPFAIISQSALIVFVIVNGLIRQDNFIYILIKIILIVIFSALAAILSARNKR